HRLPAIRPSTITRSSPLLSFSVLFTATAPSELYTLSLHDALPICADTRHLKLVHKITGGEHGAALAVIFRRVDEFQHDFRCGKGHSVQLEITQLLYLAIGDRHVGDDGLANVGLPDPYRAGAVVRNTRRIDQPGMDGKGTRCRRQIATVTAPVDEGAVDGDLAVEVVD